MKLKLFRKKRKDISDEERTVEAELEKAMAAMPKNIRKAHGHSNDKVEILASKNCACFYCFYKFTPDEVEWVGVNEMVGLCPSCGIDAVLGDKSGYDLSDSFLNEMYKYWFAT